MLHFQTAPKNRVIKKRLDYFFILDSLHECFNKKARHSYIWWKYSLEKIYEEKNNGLKIRSRIDWYEHAKKSSKFFLNLDKSRATQNKIY